MFRYTKYIMYLAHYLKSQLYNYKETQHTKTSWPFTVNKRYSYRLNVNSLKKKHVWIKPPNHIRLIHYHNALLLFRNIMPLNKAVIYIIVFRWHNVFQICLVMFSLTISLINNALSTIFRVHHKAFWYTCSLLQ